MFIKKATDAQLITWYKAGENKAFEELVNRYKNKVFVSVYAVVKDKAISEDILQESFIKAVHKITSHTYSEEGKFGPWIIRIAKNMAIDYFRKQKKNPAICIDENEGIVNTLLFSDPNNQDLNLSEKGKEKIKNMIHRLPLPQREVLMMRHYADMSFQEIAEARNVSINTALGRMRYALINLRKMFDQENITYDRIINQ
ncbi:MAG: RNA polymerase sigma factor [Cyclobacteriaceae bacterium]